MKRIYELTDFAPDPAALAVQETLFHTANGYLGVRGTLEEGLPAGSDTMRGTYINGFYDIVPMKQAEPLCHLPEEKETMLNAADTQTVRITLDGEEFSLFSGTVLHITRTLDMDEGVSIRRVLWRSPNGREAELEFRRMASFSCLPLFTIDCRVTPKNFSGTVEVLSVQEGLVRNYANRSDPRMGAESRLLLHPEDCAQDGDAVYLVSGTSQSGLHVCSGVAHTCTPALDCRCECDRGQHRAAWHFSGTLSCGQTLRLVKYTVLADSVRSADCLAAARAAMADVRGRVDALYDEQRAFLADFWARSELLVEGGEAISLALRFNLYSLLQSAGRDGVGSIAAKGLSGEGYEGHYFWDTEMYMMPFFTLTNPQIARALLHYRWSILGAARANARLLGHEKGALYPWRTITGRECSGYFPSGTAQYHINGDIAYAAVAYYLATGDLDYLAAEGAELLAETARLWLCAGSWYDGTFRLCDVTGPDEYTCIVNNNYYTNACARYNMLWAVRAVWLLEQAGRYPEALARVALGAEEQAALLQAAENMYFPRDEKLGILAQDDSFLQKPVWDIAATPRENFPLLLHYHPLQLYRYQVCKQADTVLSLFVHEDLQDEDTARRTFAYYEKVTTHDSSLSTCIFSIVAARLGLAEKAWRYFGDSALTDLDNTQGNTKDGIHTANMGGSYMAIVYGFAGLRITEAGLRLEPMLPAQWQGYRFRFCYRGSRLELHVDKTGCALTLQSGAPVSFAARGVQHTLAHAGACVRF